MLKTICKNKHTKLRGKNVTHDEIVSSIVALIDLDYNVFSKKYSKLMQDVRIAYAKKVINALEYKK